MAHKKGTGSTRNGRDSNAKRLGVKAYGGETVTAGSILIRQRGTSVLPGVNVELEREKLKLIQENKDGYCDAEN